MIVPIVGVLLLGYKIFVAPAKATLVTAKLVDHILDQPVTIAVQDGQGDILEFSVEDFVDDNGNVVVDYEVSELPDGNGHLVPVALTKGEEEILQAKELMKNHIALDITAGNRAMSQVIQAVETREKEITKQKSRRKRGSRCTKS